MFTQFIYQNQINHYLQKIGISADSFKKRKYVQSRLLRVSIRLRKKSVNCLFDILFGLRFKQISVGL